mmetsp:Transcript_3728/g.8072  ORF Transcript_3728/g.8072 Transcript_3728/m.8072 type:complete len:161 (-) Transcript_3728:58-540(-)
MPTAGLAWHVDYPYHDIEQPWPKEPLSLQVLWLLDDFREDNGATMFAPRSHELLTTPPYSFDLPHSFTGNGELLQAPVGSVLVAHGAWWHRQTINKSEQPRHALLASLTRGFVVPKADMEGQYMRMASGGILQQLNIRQQRLMQRLLMGPFERAKRDSAV